jgi:glycosyltransferase involved in cell wall biosynthesis
VKKKKRQEISLCMIVRNETENLPRCLGSVKDLVSEVIVVDTGSSDGTPDAARKHGAEVIEIPWEEDFAGARNTAIEHATKDWILVLDADEVIAPADIKTLRRALTQKNFDGYRMLSRNYTDQTYGAGFTQCTGEYPGFEADSEGKGIPGWYPTYKVRLFRRKPIMESGGTIANLPVPVHHYGVLKPEIREVKGQQYLRLGEAKVAEMPDDPRAWFELGVQTFELSDYARSKEAFERTLRVLEEQGSEVSDRFQAMGYRPDMAHVMLGVVAERTGNPNAAVESYQSALKMNPRSYEACMNWGVFLDTRGDLEGARAQFLRAAEIQPKDAKAREYLSLVSERLKTSEMNEEKPVPASPGKLPTLSLCMIVRNGAEALAQCLESVKGIVSETIIVDTGSTDGTQYEAREHGALVLEIPWPEDFAAARNHALKAATGDWVLVLDADEEIAREDRDALTALLGKGPDAYRFVTRNYVSSGSFSHFRPVDPKNHMARGAVGWFPSFKTRLFRRHPEILFEGAVHEVVDGCVDRLGWKIEETDIPIHHFGNLSEDEEKKREKRESYRRLAEKKASDGNDPKAFYEVGIHAGETDDYESAVKALRQAIDSAPDFHTRYPLLTNPYSLLGANLIRLGKAEEAVEVLDKGIRLAPKNADILHFLGLARNELGETNEAIAALKEAVSHSPGLAAAHRNLGVILRDTGRQDEARGFFEKALSLDPGMTEVREYLGRSTSGARLSLCMIVRDEAENLADCLACVKDIVDEMIVVDTGSSDGTADLARNLGAKVFSFPWCDDFSAARNESIRHATGDYIIWLDADDRFDEENRSKIKRLKDSLPPERNLAFQFILSNRQNGREMDRCRQMRLFPRLDDVGFDGRIHEQVTYSLHRKGIRTEETDIRVDHMGYPDLEGLRNKAQRNVRLMRLEAAERPENWANRFHLACALVLLRDLEEAYRENLWVVKESRCSAESPEWHYNAILHLSRLSQGRGNVEEALAWLDRAEELRPGDGFLAFSRGELLLAAGRPEEAYTTLIEAENRPIETGVFPLPTDTIRVLTQYYKGQAVDRLGRPEEAEAIYRKVLTENPGEPNAMLGLAGLLLQRGQTSEAQSFCERILALDEGNAGAWCNLGLCWVRQGDTARAEECLHRAVEFNENLTAAWMNLGHLYLGQGKAEPAALAFQKALELDPRLLSAHLGLAVLFIQSGEVIEALQRGLSSLEILGLEGPSALEGWDDLINVFEILSQFFERHGRNAEASLAGKVLKELKAFTPPETEASGGSSGTATGASPEGINPAVPMAPEGHGSVPGEKIRIHADSP